MNVNHVTQQGLCLKKPVRRHCLRDFLSIHTHETTPLALDSLDMAASGSASLLTRLGAAINNSLAAWELYLETFTENPTYDSIISTDTKDVTTKVKALQYLLETLPSRHTALAQSYCDTSLNFAELSDICRNLLDELRNPASDLDLNAWFNKIVISKRFVDGILTLGKDIGEQEQGRLQQLRRSKAIHVSLVAVLKDGELGKKEVDKMLEAMDELGVSLADTGVTGELVSSSVERSGAAM